MVRGFKSTTDGHGLYSAAAISDVDDDLALENEELEDAVAQYERGQYRCFLLICLVLAMALPATLKSNLKVGQ